jgi:glycosyltransferase involved in cell wall biosynthesis
MIDPEITAVVVSYRRPTMLRRAIQSVLNQTFPHFRVCVYDDASGDDTGKVVDEFRKRDSRVEYTCHQQNLGMTDTFINGAKQVKTRFFSFLPDDDVMLPNFFELAMAGFQRYPDAGMSILSTISITPRGFVFPVNVLRWPQGLLMPPEGMLCTLRYGNPGLQAMLIRTDAWREVGGFDKTTAPIEEVDFDVRLAARLPVVVSHDAGAIQVMHAGSFSMKTAGADWIWPIPRIISKLKDMELGPPVMQESEELLNRWMKRDLLMRGGFRSISDGEWAEARKAADLLHQRFGSVHIAHFIRFATRVCQGVPGIRRLFRAPLALRAAVRTARTLRLQWRFRSYCRLLQT